MILNILLTYFITECIATFIFVIMNKVMGPSNSPLFHAKSIFKGILERGCVIAGLTLGFPQIIIAFAALKLGTRLKEEQNSSISNDYFLVGNITSLMIAMGFAAYAKYFL